MFFRQQEDETSSTARKVSKYGPENVTYLDSFQAMML